jgi:ribonuclease HI
MIQPSLIEPYIVVFAVYSHRTDSWGLGPDVPGPAGYGAIVRRAGNRATYASHACHMTRAEVTDAGMSYVSSTLAMARTETVWITTDAAATTEQQRADLARVRELARSRALITHEPLVEVEMVKGGDGR